MPEIITPHRCHPLFPVLERRALMHIGQGGLPSAFMYRIVEDKVGAGSLAVADLGTQIYCINSVKIHGLHPAVGWAVLFSNIAPDDFDPVLWAGDPDAFPDIVVMPFIKGTNNRVIAGLPKRGFRYIYFLGLFKVTPLEATVDLILGHDICCQNHERGQIRMFAT